MWYGSLRAACALLAALLALPASAAPPRTLTVEEALRRAEEVSPALEAARARAAAGEAELAEASALLWNNPRIEGQGGTRRVPREALPEARVNEWAAGLSQTFETGGQPAHRRSAAAAARDALALGVPDARRRLRAETEQRFYRVLSLQARVAIEREAQAIAEEAAALAGKRVRAGEDSRLDGNLARVEAERARNLAAAAREQLAQARADLASLLQLPLAALPEASGALDPGPQPADRARLLETVAGRADLLAARRRVEAARNRLALERAAVAPDLTLGVSQGREVFDERFVRFSVSVPLPLFRRNEGAIGKALAEATQAETDYRAALHAARAEIGALFERYDTLEERSRRLRAEVLPALEENLRLSRRAREAGEIAVPQLLIVSRQAIETRRELLEAQTELRLVATAIEAAARREAAKP